MRPVHKDAYFAGRRDPQAIGLAGKLAVILTWIIAILVVLFALAMLFSAPGLG